MLGDARRGGALRLMAEEEAARLMARRIDRRGRRHPANAPAANRIFRARMLRPNADRAIAIRLGRGGPNF